MYMNRTSSFDDHRTRTSIADNFPEIRADLCPATMAGKHILLYKPVSYADKPVCAHTSIPQDSAHKYIKHSEQDIQIKQIGKLDKLCRSKTAFLK
jgi:hypothetical protein